MTDQTAPSARPDSEVSQVTGSGVHHARPDFETLLTEEGDRVFNRTYASVIGRFMAEMKDFDRATKLPVRPWVIGPYCDHIYPSCPHVQRSGKLDIATGGKRLWLGSYETIDDPNNVMYLSPDDENDNGDVCGWCFRVWRSRTRSAASSLTSKGAA